VDTVLLTDEEASQALGISRSKFHLLVADGQILRLKLGRSARYRKVDILAFTDRLAAEARTGAIGVVGSTGGGPADIQAACGIRSSRADGSK
jgi:excisionase family DNA binding protein